MTTVDPGQHSVADLEEELESIGTVEALESLLAAEQEGKDRQTAKAAIEARIEAVATGEAADAGAAASDGGTATDADAATADGESADADGGAADEGGSSLDGLRTTVDDAATGLVARSTTLNRLFGEDLAEPVLGTAGSFAVLALLVAGSLWSVVTTGSGSLVWTLVVSVASLFATALVVLVAVALTDVEIQWLGGGLFAAAYLVFGGGLFLVTRPLLGLLEGGPLLALGGLVAPMAAVLSIQAAALALVYEAFSRPVLPAAGADGTASLHVANWWRVAGLGVVFELLLVLAIPVWFGSAVVRFGGARAALLFLPTAGAVAALLVYVLRKATVVERAAAEG